MATDTRGKSFTMIHDFIKMVKDAEDKFAVKIHWTFNDKNLFSHMGFMYSMGSIPKRSLSELFVLKGRFEVYTTDRRTFDFTISFAMEEDAEIYNDHNTEELSEEFKENLFVQFKYFFDTKMDYYERKGFFEKKGHAA
jgi:hypothetical protein